MGQEEKRSPNSQIIDGKEVVSITEAARLNNVTRQAIYVAIKQKKLRAYKQDTKWVIDIKDLDDYTQNKYSRTKSTFNGELIFDNKKGYFSVNQVMGVEVNQVRRLDFSPQFQ